MIPLIAWREFSERLRSKLFLGINAFLLLVIVGAVVLSGMGDGGGTRVKLGVADAASADVAAIAVEQARAQDLVFEVTELAGAPAARQALARGEVEVALVDGALLMAESDVDGRVERALNAAAQAAGLAGALADAGVPPDRRAALLAPRPLEVEVLDESTGRAVGAAALVTLVAVGVLYGLLAFNGQWVAQGITEEKQSRVVEVLLASVRPSELLAGKILGLGALGLAQVTVLAGAALTAMVVTGDAAVPAGARGAVVLAAGWYVLGYGVYATLFAISGAVAARSEDLQGTTAPVIVLLVGALFAAQAALAAPGSTFATVSAWVPFTAPLVQPVRYAAGASSAPEMVGAALLTVATVAALVPAAGRFYRGGALQTRARVSLSAAWRTADR